MSQSQLEHTESIEAREVDPEPAKKVKSRRPANTAFRQQRLKAWQPILTPKTVLPLFFAIGIIFAPIGGLLLYASAQVQELIIDYSDCETQAPFRNATPAMTQIPSDKVSSSFKPSDCTSGDAPMWQKDYITKQYGLPGKTENKKTPTAVCTLQFLIPNDLKPPVLLYYRLTNFYQNHRRYVKSLDTAQLKGDAVKASTIKDGSCDPLRLDAAGLPYYPCGLVANSLFNDTFFNPVLRNVRNSTQRSQTYNMTNQGIAWESDKKLYGPTKYKLEDIAVPPNWIERWPSGKYTEDNPPPNLDQDEEFQVWMRSAGLPAFSKLAKRNENETMGCGTYRMDVELNFPATVYGGTKSIIISTRTVMGGKNPFLGIAYVVVSGICVVLGALFTVTHLIKPRKLGDHTLLTWNNNDHPAAASSALGGANANVSATATGIQRTGNDAA